jgi:thioredoxin 1
MKSRAILKRARAREDAHMRMRTSVAFALITALLVLSAGCSKDKTETRAKAEALKKAEALQTMATPYTDSTGTWSGSMAEAGDLPRMIDLGRGKCIPCKKMEPILKELKQAYAGRAIIEIVNLDNEPNAGEMYKLRLIPTQIFFDSAGSEVWRHEGFLPKDAIIARFEDMGVRPPGAESQGSGTSDAGTSREEASGD